MVCPLDAREELECLAEKGVPRVHLARRFSRDETILKRHFHPYRMESPYSATPGKPPKEFWKDQTASATTLPGQQGWESEARHDGVGGKTGQAVTIFPLYIERLFQGGVFRMAVIVTEKVNRLLIRVKVGTDPNGRDIVRTLTFGNVKTDATPQDVYDVAVALASACQYPVVDYTLEEDKDLTE
ncbi:MAG: DUF1659 domain-containing protein [Candidatus Caldatribacteriaceae bacterium]